MLEYLCGRYLILGTERTEEVPGNLSPNNWSPNRNLYWGRLAEEA
jgi:hypothetical protein